MMYVYVVYGIYVVYGVCVCVCVVCIVCMATIKQWSRAWQSLLAFGEFRGGPH